MPMQLFSYLRSSHDFMTRQLAALESGRVRLVRGELPEDDVSELAAAILREELAKVQQLMKVYGVKEEQVSRLFSAPRPGQPCSTEEA
jgi:hypothetical protein